MDHDMQTSEFDFQELLERCLGNLQFAERVLAKFQSRFDDDLLELDQALEANDSEAIARIAHRLKGASATAAANGIRHQAAEIEDLARNRNIAGIPSCLSQLRTECAKFADSVSALSKTASAG